METGWQQDIYLHKLHIMISSAMFLLDDTLRKRKQRYISMEPNTIHTLAHAAAGTDLGPQILYILFHERFLSYSYSSMEILSTSTDKHYLNMKGPFKCYVKEAYIL
ncbi:hypothetical protein ACJX0J_008287 [Zea mays]